MRRSTRMMAISSLGEDRRMKRPEYNYPESNYPDGDRRMDRYGTQSRDDYERRYPPYGMSPRRREEYARRMGEDRQNEREEAERREHEQRPQSRRMGGYEAHERSMYGGRANMMGFENDEEEEGDWEGRFRSGKAQGHHSETEKRELTEERVKKWVSGMQNSDNTRGGHFGMDRAELQRNAICSECDKLEFYAAMNMMYSDYCAVAKEMGVDRPEFYAKMAKAFLMDKDAGEGKLEKYMRHIAGK